MCFSKNSAKKSWNKNLYANLISSCPCPWASVAKFSSKSDHPFVSYRDDKGGTFFDTNTQFRKKCVKTHFSTNSAKKSWKRISPVINTVCAHAHGHQLPNLQPNWTTRSWVIVFTRTASFFDKNAQFRKNAIFKKFCKKKLTTDPTQNLISLPLGPWASVAKFSAKSDNRFLS